MKLANHCLRAIVWEHSRLLNYLHARLLEFSQTGGETGAMGIMGEQASILLLCPESFRAQILFNQRVLDGNLSACGFLPATVENRAKVFPEKYWQRCTVVSELAHRSQTKAGKHSQHDLGSRYTLLLINWDWVIFLISLSLTSFVNL